MKNRKSILIVSMALLLIASCDEPETVVTDIVHPDGSVTRKIEMRNLENKFEISKIQVPFDTTWIVKDSLEISVKGDTTWVKRAEKLFASVEEINSNYKADSGANKNVTRHADFKKKFKWFNTEYNFSEKIEKKMNYGYPVSQALTGDELKWFYSPDELTNSKKNGPDSLKFRAFSDSIDKKTEKWYMKNLASEWIGEFAKLTQGRAGEDLSQESLKKREDDFVRIAERNMSHFDSLWSDGTILREFIGEKNALNFKTEADSAVKIASDRMWVDFRNYIVRIVMPGKLTETNGSIDSSGMLIWPVRSEYFLTEQYDMRAVSKVPNRWAWIVSGLFLLFVITGILRKKRG